MLVWVTAVVQVKAHSVTVHLVRFQTDANTLNCVLVTFQTQFKAMDIDLEQSVCNGVRYFTCT